MGASVGSVVMLLSLEFSKLILIAFGLSIPVAWFAMDRWLDGFAYRIDIGVTVFLIAGVSAMAISWMTVSYQSVKAAIVNPVKSLRSE
jgi:putative ABC transport system permease protein